MLFLGGTYFMDDPIFSLVLNALIHLQQHSCFPQMLNVMVYTHFS